MVRLLLSICLALALAGASTASAVHGLAHDQTPGHHHVKDVTLDHTAQSAAPHADCCEAVGGMGSGVCLGDLAAVTGCAAAQMPHSEGAQVAAYKINSSVVRLCVPTGPPKI